MIGEAHRRELKAALQVLIGEQLSSVTFIQDYWQLDFDGSGFTVFSSITVACDDQAIPNGAAGFRDRLCQRIGTLVAEAALSPDAVVISLADGCRIELSIRDVDRSGPEALTFKSFGSDLLHVV